ncbi:MAG: single-stranded-DNA-specific exonuclease RecJ [Chitinophagales bacterium]|nr:single-stranded-DNA-specific exonuclease RecJ [Chitinophagales bacterium]
MQKRWTLREAGAEKIIALQESLKIHPVLCRLLVERGVFSYEEARSFFRPRLEELHSPWLMKDMEKAVSRIQQAMAQTEKILVFGDYDVDGTTAVASMYRFLRKIHEPLDFYIPHRYREGYGVSKAGIDFAAENGFTLIISLDCGIKSTELIRYASSLGIDFIVCDHHLPDETLPPAIAILNPKQPDCPYPYKELCGCGVGFKLMCALEERLALPGQPSLEYLDLLATAIAADIVPMTGENRILAFHGLIKANKAPNYGIKALASLSGLVKEINITNLVFMIAPRVNAAGRMDDARKAVLLFVAGSEKEALHYAEQLHSDNTDRKEADKSITEEALAGIQASPDWVNRKSTLVFQPHWHKGVVGIVASRLIEHYYRPTIVLTRSGDYVAGSARSVPGFNLYEAIHACREHLLGYGGHFAAAGMTLEPEQVDPFREKFEAVVAASIDPQLLIPEIVIDAELNLKDIRQNFYDILCQMEPFGPDNLRPVFIARRLMNTGYCKIVKEEHIRFSLKQELITITGIGFNMAKKFPLLEQQAPVDVVFTLDMNEWNDNRTLQLRVIDFRLSE